MVRRRVEVSIIITMMIIVIGRKNSPLLLIQLHHLLSRE